jgi:hypothetical protein
MPDITMCQDSKCPFKRECYRFTAEPSILQSYFSVSPLDVKKGKCDYFSHNGGVADLPVENKAVEFADKLIELILKYEIGNATFEKAKVIIENKNVWAEVTRKKSKRMKGVQSTTISGASCSLPKKSTQRTPVVTLSLDDGCTS